MAIIRPFSYREMKVTRVVHGPFGRPFFTFDYSRMLSVLGRRLYTVHGIFNLSTYIIYIQIYRDVSFLHYHSFQPITMYSYNWNAIKAIAQSGAMSQSHSKTNVVPEGTNINPDLDSEKRNCKSQDLTTNLADEKLNQDKWLVDNHLLSQLHVGIDVVRSWLSMLLRVLTSVYLLTQSLHEVLLCGLIKHGLAIGIRWKAGRGGHIMTRHGCPMGSSKRHHTLNSFHMSLVFFALLLLSFTGFPLGCLGGSTGFQFTSNKLEVVWYLNSTLQEEELQVASLVLQLNLVAILEGFADRSTRPKHSKNLTPVGTLDAIQAGHQRILFFGSPRSTLTGKTRFAASRRRLGGRGHPGAFVEDLSGLGLRVMGDSRHVSMVGGHAIRPGLHSLCCIGVVLLEGGL